MPSLSSTHERNSDVAFGVQRRPSLKPTSMICFTHMPVLHPTSGTTRRRRSHMCHSTCDVAAWENKNLGRSLPEFHWRGSERASFYVCHQNLCWCCCFSLWFCCFSRWLCCFFRFVCCSHNKSLVDRQGKAPPKIQHFNSSLFWQPNFNRFEKPAWRRNSFGTLLPTQKTNWWTKMVSLFFDRVQADISLTTSSGERSQGRLLPLQVACMRCCSSNERKEEWVDLKLWKK